MWALVESNIVSEAAQRSSPALPGVARWREAIAEAFAEPEAGRGQTVLPRVCPLRYRGRGWPLWEFPGM